MLRQDGLERGGGCAAAHPADFDGGRYDRALHLAASGNTPKLKQRAHCQACRCVGLVGSLRDYMRMWEEYYFYTAAS